MRMYISITLDWFSMVYVTVFLLLFVLPDQKGVGGESHFRNLSTAPQLPQNQFWKPNQNQNQFDKVNQNFYI